MRHGLILSVLALGLLGCPTRPSTILEIKNAFEEGLGKPFVVRASSTDPCTYKQFREIHDAMDDTVVDSEILKASFADLLQDFATIVIESPARETQTGDRVRVRHYNANSDYFDRMSQTVTSTGTPMFSLDAETATLTIRAYQIETTGSVVEHVFPSEMTPSEKDHHFYSLQAFSVEKLRDSLAHLQTLSRTYTVDTETNCKTLDAREYLRALAEFLER